MMHSSRTFNDFPRSTPSLTLPSLTPTRIPRQIYDELNSSPTNYGGVLQALFTLAIRASRDSVCWFEDCWEEFGRRGLAELLIPVGRVLALAYAAAGREDEATDLLSKIWNGAAPFGWSAPHATKGTRFSLTSGRQERRPTLYPLGKSILQLTCAKDGDNQQMEEELRELQPRYDKLQTAVIKGVDMYLDTAPYDDVSGDLRLHGFWFSDNMTFRVRGLHGFWFSDNMTFRVRVTDWPRPFPLGKPLSRARNPALQRELRKRLENAGAKILEKE
ncbi:uncharacterized protein CIMG_02751 [Coccidioides immitis RS]|uniref:Uncharacterized protein n=1 Tax=Coccidioides immitis (strain RS) TaxID=246410 RepID=J3KM15_COCIM|nr:uncharacterized protein CIMG_02751 [Coccidioides immitis RS]EAS37397.3 hypothetical protein CIMG_02751 [Coccidioides immitis RS]